MHLKILGLFSSCHGFGFLHKKISFKTKSKYKTCIFCHTKYLKMVINMNRSALDCSENGTVYVLRNLSLFDYILFLQGVPRNMTVGE